jgi:hypothetical protein
MPCLLYAEDAAELDCGEREVQGEKVEEIREGSKGPQQLLGYRSRRFFHDGSK